MAKKDSILYDKTELVLVDRTVKNNPTRINAPYDKITSIRFQKCTEKKLFKTIDSEKIVITLAGKAPLSYYKYDEGEENFEKYKKQLETFAKDNRVTFSSEL